MFDNIRKVLDEFEIAYDAVMKNYSNATKDQENTLLYFNVNLAQALMQNEYTRSESVAKIILAAKELSNVVTVKVE